MGSVSKQSEYKSKITIDQTIKGLKDINENPYLEFLKFKRWVELKKEFEVYYKKCPEYKSVNNMRRGKRSRTKRKLFAQWYIIKHQNERTINEMLVDIADMCFVDKRTIELDIYG